MTEEGRLRDLRRMKVIATGVLVAAFIIWIVTWRAEVNGAPTWVGFVRAGAEAAMIGGLADWFAVTAIFRHPLGIPIPHTALIPKKKDALGVSLSDFVGTNFLAEDVVRDRVRRANVAGRVGAWLASGANADRVTLELASAARGALEVLSDSDVQELLEKTLITRLSRIEAGPPLGRVLQGVLSDRAHTSAVDALADYAHTWLLQHPQEVVDAVAAASPSWSPKFVDDMLGTRVHTELVRVAREVRENPEHPLRGTIDSALGQLAERLQNDPEMMARAEAAKQQLLHHPSTRDAINDLGATSRRMILEAVDDPESELRRRVSLAIRNAGQRLVDDPEWRGKANVWIENAVAHVVSNYRDELTRTITETIEKWDGKEAARRIEIAAGRDLQFIRINGAVVGALVGVLIHAISLYVV